MTSPEGPEPQPHEQLTREQKTVLAANTIFCMEYGLADLYSVETLALAEGVLESDRAEGEEFEPDNIGFQESVRSLPGSDLPFAFGVLDECSFHVFKVNPVTRRVPVGQSVEIGLITEEGGLVAGSATGLSEDVVTTAYALYHAQLAAGLEFDPEGW